MCLLAWGWAKPTPPETRKYSILTSDMRMHVSATPTCAYAASVWACGVYRWVGIQKLKKFMRALRARAALLLNKVLLTAPFSDRIIVRGNFSECSARATRAVTPQM